MKITHVFLVVTCVLLSCTHYLLPISAAPDINQLRGPTTNTRVPAPGDGAVTDPGSGTYSAGSSSRLALYVPGNIYKDYPGWLPLYKALVFHGIPVTVTKDAKVARSHSAVIAYQAFQSKYMGFSDSLSWSRYVSNGNTLISVGMTSNDLLLRMTFGVSPDTATPKPLAREAIVLQKPLASYPTTNVNDQFDFTDARDIEIPLYRKSTKEGFPSIGYKLDYGAKSLGAYRTDNKNLDGKHGITIHSGIFGGRAVAIGIDLGAYIGEANGGKTKGIPRSYVAQYEPGYDTFMRIIKQLYVTST
ncbi:hypothetical protein BGZ94_008196, partial [Podila epigama]